MRNVAIAALAVAAGSAFAGVSQNDAVKIQSHIDYNVATGEITRIFTDGTTSSSQSSRMPVDMYRNTAAVEAGTTNDAGLLLGDDVTIGTSGRLDVIETSVVNFTGPGVGFFETGTLLDGTLSVEFWTINGAGDGLDTQFFDLDIDIGDLFGPAGLAGGGSGSFLTLSGLSGLGLDLTAGDQFVVGSRYENLSFAGGQNAGDDLGQLTSAGPATAGSSQGVFFIEGFGFGSFSTINSDLQWALVTPAPGALALLGLGGFAATRRRR
ncbi:MAG: hypothetical protein AAF995_00795 [Planctomycetota bacterium]